MKTVVMVSCSIIGKIWNIGLIERLIFNSRNGFRTIQHAVVTFKQKKKNLLSDVYPNEDNPHPFRKLGVNSKFWFFISCFQIVISLITFTLQFIFLENLMFILFFQVALSHSSSRMEVSIGGLNKNPRQNKISAAVIKKLA